MSKLNIPNEDHVLVVLDTETTGLDHKTEQIIEIGAVKLKKPVPFEEGESEGNTEENSSDETENWEIFSSLIKPTVPIRYSSFKIHGITDEMLENAPSIEEVLPRFLEFIGDLPFVAHNAIFDYSFINEASKTVVGTTFRNHRVDTLDMYRRVFPDEPSHSLSSLLERFGYDSYVSHRALDDSKNLARVYHQLRALYVQKQEWQFSQLENVPYLLERYLRIQRAVQVMQAEMSDLKDVFKLHFSEGGKSLEATTGEQMVVYSKRSYEYDDEQVWPLLIETGLVERAARINAKQLDKLIHKGELSPEYLDQLKETRVNMHESTSVSFIKPQPSDTQQSERTEKESSSETSSETGTTES